MTWTESRILALFRLEAGRIWENPEMLASVDMSVTIDKFKKSLAQLEYFWTGSSKPYASGLYLRKVAHRVILHVNPRALDLSNEDFVKVIRHEVLHLGHVNHSSEFIRLCEIVGAVPSENALKGEGWHIEGKVGHRYQLVETFKGTEKEAVARMNEIFKSGAYPRMRLML